MKTVRATEANRQFSSVLKKVSRGEEFVILSRGKPVATIAPTRTADRTRKAARKRLLDQLRKRKPTGARTWTREELYDRRS